MGNLSARIESLLFVSSKPLTVKRLASAIDRSVEETEQALGMLIKEMDQRKGGTAIVRTGKEVQLTTSLESSNIVRRFLKEEQTGELTRPSLETLTIVAYRGPIRRSELELIRGVNCSLILRNLLIRGLVVEEKDEETGESIVRPSMDFLKWLGVKQALELPDYERLSSSEILNQLLKSEQRSKTPQPKPEP